MHHTPARILAALMTLAPLQALAQSVEFLSVGAAVPTLSPVSLILLGLLVAGAAFWLTRKRALATRVLTLAALVSGTAFLASHTELVAKAWAGADAVQIGATHSPVVLANPTDGLRYQIQNNTGGAIVITALVDGGDGSGCAAAGSYWDVEPEEGYQIGVPGCAPKVMVPSGKTCVVVVSCAIGGGGA